MTIVTAVHRWIRRRSRRKMEARFRLMLRRLETPPVSRDDWQNNDARHDEN